jgi:hypothetical protein
MSAADDQPFVPKGERTEVPYADDSAAAKEDERTAESEATGKIPSSEYRIQHACRAASLIGFELVGDGARTPAVAVLLSGRYHGDL